MHNINIIPRYFLFTLFTIFVLNSCQSTQKTTGEGLISVVAQNVLKIAGNQAIQNANFSNLNNLCK